MKLPSRNSVTGQVLRLMLDGKARSKLEITDQLNLHPAKEVTARLRDFRKPEGEGGLRIDVDHYHRMDDGQRVDLYQFTYVPASLLQAFANESREFAA